MTAQRSLEHRAKVGACVFALAIAACATKGSSTGGAGGAGGSAASSGGSGGTTSSGGSAGSGGAAASGGTGGSGAAECPTTPPTLYGECPVELNPTSCSYGDSILPECREEWRCECISQQPGIACHWQGASSPVACAANDAGACPASAPVAGADGGLAACDAAADGTRCGYADGTICHCTSCLEVGGPCQPVTPPRWSCSPPPATSGCPPTIPNAGTACSQPALRCIYDSYCGIEATCELDRWTWQFLPCPQ